MIVEFLEAEEIEITTPAWLGTKRRTTTKQEAAEKTDPEHEEPATPSGEAETAEAQASGEIAQASGLINCAAFRVVGVCPIWGDIIEVPNVDGGLSRVARRQLENPARLILAQYTKAGKSKGGKGVHRGNLRLACAELTPTAAQESAMRARGWKVARYPRSAEQRDKLAGLGFLPYIQAGEGEFKVHGLGLVWAKPGEASGEQAKQPEAATPSGEDVSTSGEAEPAQTSGEAPTRRSLKR